MRGSVTFLHWKNHAKFRDVLYVQVDSVEAVTQVHLDQSDGAQGWIGEQDFSKDPIQGVAKLHRLHSSGGKGFRIYSIEREVHDCARPPAILLNDSRRCDPQAWQIFDITSAKYNPLTLRSHVGELLLQEVDVSETRLVGTSLQGLVDPIPVPRLSRKLDWGSSIPVVLQ